MGPGINTAHLLRHAADIGAATPAVLQGGRALYSYRELAVQAARYAAALRAQGLQEGDRIVIAAPNWGDYLTILFAGWHAGLCVVPINSKLHAREIQSIAQDCDAKLIVTTSEIGGLLSGSRTTLLIDTPAFKRFAEYSPAPMAEVMSDAPAWLFYTSGTTGRSKGAILTHRNLQAMTTTFLADSGAAVDDAVLHLAPLSHGSGLVALPDVGRARPNILLTAGITRDTLATALQCVERLSFFAVPTVVNRMVQEQLIDDVLMKKLHRIFFGGAPMYVADLKRALGYFGSQRLWHLYGQGEVPITITYVAPGMWGIPDSPQYEQRLASVGIARSGVELRIASIGDADPASGPEGEVEVRGDVVMLGYWNNPQATAAALQDGWLRTGDIGRIDEHGWLTLTDRLKDVIISGGSNIYPREIEEVLLRSPAVAECAVVGIPNPEWGEIPVAFVVPASPVDATVLENLCLESLARFKRPRVFHFVDVLPKSSYGKILKRELIARLA
jgi:acyl-CoA synthetase (AMP-forming)/AMP-acid ligase II